MDNITRWRADLKKRKMAWSSKRMLDLEHDGSLLIDSILSQDEENDVVSMLSIADELEDGLKLHILSNGREEPYPPTPVSYIIAHLLH